MKTGEIFEAAKNKILTKENVDRLFEIAADVFMKKVDSVGQHFNDVNNSDSDVAVPSMVYTKKMNGKTYTVRKYKNV